MPITPFLYNQAFDSETIEAMVAAFTQVCAELGLTDRNDKLTEIVARHIIEAAQRGLRVRSALYLDAMEWFKGIRH